MCGEVFYGEVGDWRQGPPVIKTDEGVVERVFVVVERGEVRARLLFALKKEVFFFSLFNATRQISIEVTAFLPY